MNQSGRQDTVAPPPSPAQLPLLDGDTKQVGQPPLRVSPCSRPQLAEYLVLRAGPEWARGLQGPSPFRRESHRLDPPVGVRNTVDHTIPLQEVEAPRQGRLVDGERVLELPQVRLAHARDHRENAVLSHPQTARPQVVVVQLRDSPGRHAECVADTGGQSSRVLSGRQSGVSSLHAVMLPATVLLGKDFICRYIIIHSCTGTCGAPTKG